MKILVVDDHELILEALRGVLKEELKRDAIVLEAADSRQVMQFVSERKVIKFAGIKPE